MTTKQNGKTKREYKMHLCYNGSKRQIEDTYVFDSKREWHFAIETMPYDIIDEDESNCWVDYGDCD